MMRAGFSWRLATGIACLALLAAGGEAAANAGDPQQVAATFNTAILVLLIPVALLLAAAGLLVWRFRDDAGGGYLGTLDAPAEAPRTPGSMTRVLPLRRSRH
jgi:hypothetical protein